MRRATQQQQQQHDTKHLKQYRLNNNSNTEFENVQTQLYCTQAGLTINNQALRPVLQQHVDDCIDSIDVRMSYDEVEIKEAEGTECFTLDTTTRDKSIYFTSRRRRLKGKRPQVFRSNEIHRYDQRNSHSAGTSENLHSTLGNNGNHCHIPVDSRCEQEQRRGGRTSMIDNGANVAHGAGRAGIVRVNLQQIYSTGTDNCAGTLKPVHSESSCMCSAAKSNTDKTQNLWKQDHDVAGSSGAARVPQANLQTTKRRYWRRQSKLALQRDKVIKVVDV